MYPPIFNSLGSNYSPEFKKLCQDLLHDRIECEGAKSDLIDYCNHKFKGQTALLEKGRQAITYGLKTCGIKTGDEVLMQANTCYAVYQGVKQSGANPRFVDVEKNGLNLNLTTLKSALAKAHNPKAILVQHNLGYAVKNMKRIAGWCKKNHLFLIEDLAHAVGAKSEEGKDLGTYADVVILSFGQDKIWDAITGGAAVIKFKNKNIGNTIKKEIKNRHLLVDSQNYSLSNTKLLWYPTISGLIRWSLRFGLAGKLFHKLIQKLNFIPRSVDDPTLDLQPMRKKFAYLALFQSKNIENEIKHRKQIALIYDSYLSNKLKMVNARQIKASTNLRYPLLVENTEEVKTEGKSMGLHIFDTWYDHPIAPLRYMPRVEEYVLSSYPHAEYVTSHLINLPTHRLITPKLAKEIAKIINTLAVAP